jgi:predicted PurR-regulated permease PerM
METATTIIIFIVALLIAVGFLLLVLTLVPAINQLRILFRELEKTSMEIRGLTVELKKISSNVADKIEMVDGVLATSRKIVKNMGGIIQFINTNLIKKAGFLTIIPAVKWGMNYLSKNKKGR